MKNLMEVCRQAMDLFENGDLGTDEGYPSHIRSKILDVVAQLDQLKGMAAEEQIENEIDAAKH